MKSIDKENFGFESKILSIDDFGEGISEEVKKYTDSNNWTVLMGEPSGMVNNQLRALSIIDDEWVLYCEDDVLVEKLPTKEQLEELHSKVDDIGLVSLTGGGYMTEMAIPGHPRYSPKLAEEILDNIKNPDNHVIVDGDDATFWYRNPKFNNGWFFEFPSLFIKTDIFNTCINTSLTRFKGRQIEQSYTMSYFSLGYHEKYKRYTWAKNINNHLDFNRPTADLLGDISGSLIHIQHNRNDHSPSVGSGYYV
jgi:hypothetical protein